MAEKSLDRYILSNMRGRWRKGVKHADGFTAGIADLSAWLDGIGNVWVEDKALDSWPKRETTPVKVGLDDLQKDFLWERHGWLMVRVKREYFLFDREGARHLELDTTTQATFRRWAVRHWTGAVNWNQFTEEIRGGC